MLSLQRAPEPRGEMDVLQKFIFDVAHCICKTNFLDISASFFLDTTWRNMRADANLQKGKERIANILVFLGVLL